LPYTMCTRSPWHDNIYFVGVPPVDVLAAILRPDASGRNRVDRLRVALETLLGDAVALENQMQRRVDSGEFDLKAIAETLSPDASTTDSPPAGTWNCESRLDRAREHLITCLRRMYTGWVQRLNVAQGLATMCAVNEGFTYKAGILTARKDRKKHWLPLADVLQQDVNNRRRIWYYHEVAVEWMQHPHVNALADAAVGKPRLARRSDSRPEALRGVPCHDLNGIVQGYDEAIQRPPCPQKPSDLPWSTSVDSAGRGVPPVSSTAPPEEPTALPSVTEHGDVLCSGPVASTVLPTSAQAAMRSIFPETHVPVAVSTDAGDVIPLPYAWLKLTISPCFSQ